jgi:L-ascorbate metabolism protein UlaG (beta-lactamase superfamily)
VRVVHGYIYLFGTILSVLTSSAQDQLRLDVPQVTTNWDANLRWTNSATPYITLERAANLGQWEPLTTLKATDSGYSDTGAGYRTNGFYRAVQVSDTNVVTGDHLLTDNGPLTIHPVNHASFVMTWNGLTIYNDPVGTAALYSAFPRADLILVSHDHSDHYNPNTLAAVRKTNSVIIASRAVYNMLSTDLKAITTVLANGAGTNVFGIQIDAVPAYNSNHQKGTGNGYVLALGGKRIYITGDTGALNEMKSLTGIDVAFVCMNVPYTMTVSQAAGIVKEFAPRVVYPYHYRNQDNTFSDLTAFRRQVGTEQGIEVRARKWY